MTLYRCTLPACSKLIRAGHTSEGKTCPLCETGTLTRVRGDQPTKQQQIDHERAEGVRSG